MYFSIFMFKRNKAGLNGNRSVPLLYPDICISIRNESQIAASLNGTCGMTFQVKWFCGRQGNLSGPASIASDGNMIPAWIVTWFKEHFSIFVTRCFGTSLNLWRWGVNGFPLVCTQFEEEPKYKIWFLLCSVLWLIKRWWTKKNKQAREMESTVYLCL